MSSLSRLGLVAITVAATVFAAGGTISGQQAPAGAGLVMDPAKAQRSLEVQAELARIGANKEAFVNELLERWAPLVGNEVDLWGDLKAIAMAATPWRLLGASLATDFDSGSAVLRGVVGPGWYVGAFVEGREPVIGASTLQAQAGVPNPVQAALGDQLSSLVFTPINPCRIVDTRGSGARAGIMAAGETRTFDLSTDGFAKGQGGQTSCAGLPSYQHKAWAVNITTVGYSAPGHVTVWPYLYSKPATSFMNFFPTAYAVANAGTVTGCNACVESIYLSVAASTHVIIDVMGYYGEATTFATGAMTDFAGTLVTGIAPGAAATALGPDCPAGTVFVSGAVDTSSSAGNVVLAEQWRTAGSGWRQVLRNISGTITYSATAWSRCMDVQ